MGFRRFKIKMCSKEDPTSWTTLIVVVAVDRKAALNKLCQLMADEPYLRDLIGYASAMEVEQVI